uniref:Uncharacterized protein n=1 Tax=Acetithermum autotrophicum TaxID=1446466 RepID=H5SQD7_ACEAU|nr:hypothetical protein HGMM_OP1C068 [Candidatus Acetothermum autotrophicum]
MKKLTQQTYKSLGLIVTVLVVGGLVFTSTPEPSVVAQQAQPIPSANDDVRIVAGLLLAQELLDIASKEAVTPDGMFKLATQPIQDKGPEMGRQWSDSASARCCRHKQLGPQRAPLVEQRDQSHS